MTDESLTADGGYYSRHQKQWERSASIRSRPRRTLLGVSDKDYLFPISRQPICLHPLVKSLGREAVAFILTQSLYKFLNDIAFIETEVVNRVAFKISNRKLGFDFSKETRMDALLVLIDESYHAYVALDFMRQVEEQTGIEPLPLPEEIELTAAARAALSRLPEDCHEAFEVTAVCIAENSLTKQLIDISREKNLNKTYDQVNSDHMCDEVRHSAVFAHILKTLWADMAETARVNIGESLPGFIGAYLKPDIQKAFDIKILRALNLGADEIERVIADTHVEKGIEDLKLSNPVVGNILKLFNATGILSHPPTRRVFSRHNLIAD